MWETIDFVLNGFVFLLLGFQLPYILAGIHLHHLGRLVLLGLLFSGVVILLRFVWVYPGAMLSYAIRRRLLHQPEPLPSPKALFIVGWAGMRGVIALAAAISLPRMLDSGASFPRAQLDDLPYILRDFCDPCACKGSRCLR